MKTTTRLLLIAFLALPLLAACKKEEAAQVEAVQAPLVAPTSTDGPAWDTYLTEVVKRNSEGASSLYAYTLPAPDSADFQGYYDRQLDAAKTSVARGGVEGTLVAFGSPSSPKSADLAVASFEGVQPSSMKGVRVLFIGAAADRDRVKAAVEPSGATFQFVEAK